MMVVCYLAVARWAQGRGRQVNGLAMKREGMKKHAVGKFVKGAILEYYRNTRLEIVYRSGMMIL
jgi:hypothetical protein